MKKALKALKEKKHKETDRKYWGRIPTIVEDVPLSKYVRLMVDYRGATEFVGIIILVVLMTIILFTK